MIENMTDAEKQEYEEFVQKNTKGHYAQSLLWAELKKEWKNEVVIVRNKDGSIKGTMLLLIRKIPFFKSTIVYSPRGPVCDIHDEETLTELLKEAEKVAKKHKAFLLKFDPDIANDDMVFKNIMKKNKFKVIEKLKDINRAVMSRVVFRLNLKGKTEDEVLKGFHSKTRYNIRVAIKKGVTIRQGNKDDIDEFYELLKVTSNRDKFPIRGKEFFEELFDSLGEDHIRLLFADYEGKSIAAIFDFLYGDKMWYRYGASSNEHRNLMPTYLLQWECIKIAIQNNCNWYDLSGINSVDKETKHEGLYRFKKGFSTDLIEFTEICKVYNYFIFFLYDKCFELYRKIRIKMKK